MASVEYGIAYGFVIGKRQGITNLCTLSHGPGRLLIGNNANIEPRALCAHITDLYKESASKIALDSAVPGSCVGRAVVARNSEIIGYFLGRGYKKTLRQC